MKTLSRGMFHLIPSLQHVHKLTILSVIFSEWTDHLDLIQIALEDNSFKYTRLDGSMNRTSRKNALQVFDHDPNICIILVSTKAGGLGINLTVASKVYVMEPLYNPAAEAQAVDRVHRLGQKRAVEISRFIMRGSFEERILELQRKKLELADLSMNRKMDRADKNAEKIQELRDLFR
jgi:SNF2 family DNA or RNA helicase